MRAKLFVILTMLAWLAGFTSIVFLTVAHAQTWVTANQVTVGWDAVTTLLDGTPVPAADKVSYNTYIKNRKTGAIISVGNTPSNQAPIVFVLEGRYWIGVSALRHVLAADGIAVEESLESTIAWSEDPLVCLNAETFGVRYFVNPNDPKNLHR